MSNVTPAVLTACPATRPHPVRDAVRQDGASGPAFLALCRNADHRCENDGAIYFSTEIAVQLCWKAACGMNPLTPGMAACATGAVPMAARPWVLHPEHLGLE